MAAITRHRNWQKPEDVRELFAAIGIGQFVMPMAIQYAFFLPRTSDPYAQGIIFIVKGLQRTLNRRGAMLPVDGGLDEQTAAMIERVSGPDWQNKTWIQLASDAIAAEVVPLERFQPTVAVAGYPRQALGASFLTDLAFSPLGLMAIGGGLWLLWTGRKKR